MLLFLLYPFLHRINYLFHKEIVDDSVYYAIYNDKNWLYKGLLFRDTGPLMIISCLFCYPYLIIVLSLFIHRIIELFNKEIVEDPVLYAIYNDKNGPHKGLIIYGQRASYDCLLFVLLSLFYYCFVAF